MNIKKMVVNSLLLSIGALLHQITPPLVLGMKPDFSLVMLFIVLFYNKDFKSCITAGFAIGIFSALTTGFPAGQVPNIIDKLVTTTVIYFCIKILTKRVVDQILMIIVISVGTFISGIVFLSSAAILSGIQDNFIELLSLIVIPAVIINTIIGMILYNSVKLSIKRSHFKIN